MSLSDEIETVTFDSFSTVVEISSGEEILSDYISNPSEASRQWRIQTLWFRVLANHLGYRPHYNVNADALRYIFEQYDVDLDYETIKDIAHRVYHNMTPFDDVRDGMKRLHDAGYDLYIVSNGNPEVLDSMIENAEIQDLIENTISSEEVQVFKPHIQLYKHAAKRTDTPPEKIIHASAGWMDVQGGMYAGMKGAWINRKNRPEGIQVFDGDPDVDAKDFHELANALDA